MRKKGQVPVKGTSAAMLVAIIAAMIILYVLFLPPDERAKILEETNENGNNGDNGDELDGKVLLEKDPGRLDLIKKKTIEHKISSFNLVSSTEGQLLKEFDSVYVENTPFGEEISVTLNFDIEDPQNTDNVLLSFTNAEHSGRLTITLNGNKISEKNIEAGTPSPIKVPKSAIDDNNEIVFSTPKPSKIFFWKQNFYSLEDIKLFGDITYKEGLENTQTFFVTEIEKENLEKVVVSFMTNCRTNLVGTLDVLMNNQRIYSGIPDCEIPIKLELAPNNVIEGENKIKFSADKGSYVIDQITIKTHLEDEIYPTYYFELEDDEFKLLEDDEIDVNMSIIFVKDDDFQDIEVEINGRKFSIDNKERIYEEVIDPYLREGNNAITLRPLDGTVEIVELKIFIVDIDEEDE